MLTALTLPLVGILLAFPFPGFNTIKALRNKPAAPLDSLPPPWKPASRLALENEFVRAALPSLGPRVGALRLVNDPRRLRISVQPDSGMLTASTEVGNVALEGSPRLKLADFTRDLSRRNFERLWRERSQTSINSAGAGSGVAASHTGIQIGLPVQLPARLQGVLGPGGPALNISGSENIKLSGQSEWSNQQTGLLGQRRSLFPALDMQQDLDIRLEGQLSDRVKVNLLQNSANQIPLANRIAINYKGDEDDLIQSLDLGNTNLALPGTQYVSYSGKNEGLFGVKASSRMGPVDFTILASKQEGRSERAAYQGGASRQSQGIYDKDYIKGAYFFLYDPNRNSNTGTGGVRVERIIESSIKVYQDDGVYPTEINLVRARAFVNPDSASDDSAATPWVRGIFKLLKADADDGYEILTNVYSSDFPVIRLTRPLTGEKRLAVSYSWLRGPGDTVNVLGDSPIDPLYRTPTLRLKLIRPAQQDLTLVTSGANSGFFDPSNPFDVTRDLELKNFYQLGGQSIDRKTFEMQIHYGDFQPYRTSFQEPGTDPVPYIEVVGLDNFDESGGFISYDRKGHDGKVDGTGPQANYRVFLDDANGVLFLPDLRPFAPQLATPFQRIRINPNLSRRALLTGGPATGTEPNPAIYDKRNLLSNDRLYTIDVTFTAARASGEINLGRSNLVEGSDVVTINGQPLRRDVDYRIDYDIGKVTLIRQLGPADQVNVDYAYAPLFQQAGKTLLGSAFRYEGRDRSLGGAFLYESKGQQELRPRIGEEPSRVVIGDLNTEWTFRPEWMTRLVDRLPGVRTTASSELLVGAEAGASFPNPNTRNEVFVDDMEGVRDAVSLSMGPERWRWSSIPMRPGGGTVENSGAAPHENAEIHWFSPLNAIKERDLKPTLTNAEGAQNSRQVLALSLPKRPADAPATSQPLWAGLMYPLDAAGIDLSRSQFIEVWVNDFRDNHNGVPSPRVRTGGADGTGVKLHIDLGTMSEDQRRAPNVPPNGLLDSEDLRPQDNQLTVVGSNNEDTGYDNQLSKDENAPPDTSRHDLEIVPDLTTRDASDPRGDDFKVPDDNYTDLAPGKWTRINGPEDNKQISPIPDTEDLNLNRALDTYNNYFEYTIDLGDEASPYLVTDVYKSFSPVGYTNDGSPLRVDNGWRRYRIPIGDDARTRIGAPDLSLSRQVRVWLENVGQVDPPALPPDRDGKLDGRPFVMVGGLEIVGSRWLAADLDSASVAGNTTLTLNSVNTLENADVYSPPFTPETQRQGSQAVQLREQSLSLEFEQLRPAATIEAFKTFSLDEDYSRYGHLNWYIASFRATACAATYDTLDYFVRFSSDERGTSYYEYRSRVPVSTVARVINWQYVNLKLTDISNLKLNSDFPKTGDIFYSAPGKNPGETYIVRGRPSFTRLRRISVGVLNTTAANLPCGQLWFDEVRATDIAKESGYAQRLDVRGRMANLLTYTIGYGGRDANFQSVGESRGSGNQNSQLNVATTFNLHQFFEATGIVLPVSFTYSNSRAVPRYSAGDDVVRIGAIADASQTRSTTRGFATSYTRSWSEKANPFLRYTIGGVSANLQMGDFDGNTPSTLSSSKSLQAAVNYGISPRRLLELPIPRTKLKLFPLPERFYWNYNVGTSRATAYNRLLDSTRTLTLLYDTQGRTGSIDFGADTRPIDAFHHSFSARRNLTLPHPLLEQIGFINLGRVVSWRQTMDTRYAAQKYGPWLKPVLSWNANYNQANGPELSPDLSVRQISNGQTLALTWDFPFDKLAQVTQRVGAPPAPRDTSRRGPVPPPSWRRFMSRLGAISTDASFNRNSGFTRLSGSPNFLYLAGVSNEPGLNDGSGRMQEAFGNRSDDGYDWRTGARTRFDLGLGASLGTKFAATARRTTSNGVTNRRNEVRFPDLEVTYGRVVDVIGLRRFLTNPQLQTSYYQTSSKEFSNSDQPTTVSGSSYWQPLVKVSGELKNGTRTELRVERRTTKSENRLLGSSVTTDRNTDVNLSLSRSYSQGQKVNVLGKETTVRTSVNLGLTGSYQRHTGETRQAGFSRPQSEVRTDRLSVNGSGSYGFSNNVTGNAELGFGQNRDLRLGSVSRSVRVELRAQFTF